MVNGIFTIPLPAPHGDLRAGVAAAEAPLREFIGGPENALTPAALRPFLEGMITQSSPLLLYGPHGTGKSHLAYGLAAWWRQHFPAAKVVCLAGAEFAQECAGAVRDGRLSAFRQRMQGADLLVLDNLAQLSGKRTAQEELALALDALVDRQAFVVVTARALPTHSPVFLAGLRGRLSAGLAVSLALPSAATRRVILERVAAERGISLPKRAAHCLADHLEASVPALLAAVGELQLTASSAGRSLDCDCVQQFVAQRKAEQMPNLRDIAGLTAKYFGMKLSDLKSPLRRQPLVACRGVAMYLARQLTDKSLEQIGAFFGGRDHTTVIHGCRRTEKMLHHDRATRQAVADLKKLLVAT